MIEPAQKCFPMKLLYILLECLRLISHGYACSIEYVPLIILLYFEIPQFVIYIYTNERIKYNNNNNNRQYNLFI
jgi:hypothetical protein